MLGLVGLTCALLSSLSVTAVEAMSEPQLETSRYSQAAQRTEFGVEGDTSSFLFSFSDAEVTAVTDNHAVLQQRVSKSSNPFLATLSGSGISQYLTAVKPCGIVMPHIHLRGNELYTVLYGTMDAGISQENGYNQSITFEVDPGEAFLVPQGLLHYNHNSRCRPNFFTQTFTSSDAGSINVVGALAALRDGGAAGAAAIAASGAAAVTASDYGSYALDAACLARCGLPETGAPGDGLHGLPQSMRTMLGLPRISDDEVAAASDGVEEEGKRVRHARGYYGARD